MSRLPLGWACARLEDVVEILDSQRIPLNSGERQARIAGKDNATLVPYYGATGQVGLIDSHIFDDDLVLLGEDGVPFLDLFKHKAYRITGKSWVNNHAHVLRARAEVTISRYVEGYLNTFDYTGVVTGSTRLKLTQAAMRDIPISIAPLSEQKRISEKLDSLLARVNAARERLDCVPMLLKRFRQSVLAAATSGELTEEWRGTVEASWEMVALKDVATDFSYGSSTKSSKEGAIPVLRMGNIQSGILDWEDLVFTSDKTEIAKYKLSIGDVLFNRTNSPELVGKTAVFRCEREAIYAGYPIRVRCSEKLLPDFLSFCLNGPIGLHWRWEVKTDGVSQSNINATKLAAFEFELPPIDEQRAIVRRVEALFALADKVQAQYEAARARVDKVTPALLAKAFRGELVPQDPHDEPASVLLERLQASKTSAPKPVKKGRRSSATVRRARNASR